MEREHFYKTMREFIAELAAERTGEPVTTAIGEDDNLFDLGLINSFSIIQMIVFIEELTGTSIDLSAHELETFYTLRGIYSLAQDSAGDGVK
jgi:acyl carrier protein